jgi:hypothetical protein
MSKNYTKSISNIESFTGFDIGGTGNSAVDDYFSQVTGDTVVNIDFTLTPEELITKNNAMAQLNPAPISIEYSGVPGMIVYVDVINHPFWVIYISTHDDVIAEMHDSTKFYDAGTYGQTLWHAAHMIYQCMYTYFISPNFKNTGWNVNSNNNSVIITGGNGSHYINAMHYSTDKWDTFWTDYDAFFASLSLAPSTNDYWRGQPAHDKTAQMYANGGINYENFHINLDNNVEYKHLTMLDDIYPRVMGNDIYDGIAYLRNTDIVGSNNSSLPQPAYPVVGFSIPGQTNPDMFGDYSDVDTRHNNLSGSKRMDGMKSCLYIGQMVYSVKEATVVCRNKNKWKTAGLGVSSGNPMTWEKSVQWLNDNPGQSIAHTAIGTHAHSFAWNGPRTWENLIYHSYDNRYRRQGAGRQSYSFALMHGEYFNRLSESVRGLGIENNFMLMSDAHENVASSQAKDANGAPLFTAEGFEIPTFTTSLSGVVDDGSCAYPGTLTMDYAHAELATQLFGGNYGYVKSVLNNDGGKPYINDGGHIRDYDLNINSPFNFINKGGPITGGDEFESRTGNDNTDGCGYNGTLLPQYKDINVQMIQVPFGLRVWMFDRPNFMGNCEIVSCFDPEGVKQFWHSNNRMEQGISDPGRLYHGALSMVKTSDQSTVQFHGTHGRGQPQWMKPPIDKLLDYKEGGIYDAWMLRPGLTKNSAAVKSTIACPLVRPFWSNKCIRSLRVQCIIREPEVAFTRMLTNILSQEMQVSKSLSEHGWDYKGCYLDKNNTQDNSFKSRDFKYQKYNDGSIVNQSTCRNFAKTMGSKYFGMRKDENNIMQCFAGDKYGKYAKSQSSTPTDSKCTDECPSDNTTSRLIDTLGTPGCGGNTNITGVGILNHVSVYGVQELNSGQIECDSDCQVRRNNRRIAFESGNLSLSTLNVP